jgi:hypothetical protein
MERLLTVALPVSGRWPFDVMMQWGWQRSPAIQDGRTVINGRQDRRNSGRHA